MANRALIYQIYPASFGTLRRITQKIPEIAENIAPDYIWLSPIFLSPWREGGYDVADYREIDPRFGTQKDFKNLIQTAKKHHIGILLDLVLNHTSIDHDWFQKSRHRDPLYDNYYVWTDRRLNWRSLFGGPAYEYDCVRGQYYLHVYDMSQPDLNFKNNNVIREFERIIDYWQSLGIAGFRVDSANILDETKLKYSFLPFLPGFFHYFQTKSTVRILDRLFARRGLFTLSESVGGDLFSKQQAKELTRRAFTATFNVGMIDVADTYFSNKAAPRAVQYKKWFKKLTSWAPEPNISFAIESHDSPRAISRFFPDAKTPAGQIKAAKTLAMLQFFLPSHYPCIYQGQEIGTIDPKLGNDIYTYPDVQSRAIYQQLVKKGKSHRAAMTIVKKTSRDNARAPLDWVQYATQPPDPGSVLNFYKRVLDLWRTDPILIHGSFKPKRITKDGVFDFTRTYRGKTYLIHLDFTLRTPSTLTIQNQILLTT